jgi:metallo-beta-lactamase class B
MRSAALLIILGSAAVAAQAPLLTSQQLAQFHGSYSESVEPFRIVGNVYYVGAQNIASYLITTRDGHILIDTGTNEMGPVVRANVEKLGYKLTDIGIMLSSHAHFDHIQGHAAMKKATGARVMAIREDAEALEAGKDLSPLGSEGWDPVKVDRRLKDGDTVLLGGTTLRATHAPGHTPGCTVWTTTVPDLGREYFVVFHGCGGPNAGVKMVGNPKFPNLVSQAMGTIAKLKQLEPDIYLTGHPQALFEGKIDAMKTGTRPHPLLITRDAWLKMLNENEANLKKRIDDERAQISSR